MVVVLFELIPPFGEVKSSVVLVKETLPPNSTHPAEAKPFDTSEVVLDVEGCEFDNAGESWQLAANPDKRSKEMIEYIFILFGLVNKYKNKFNKGVECEENTFPFIQSVAMVVIPPYNKKNCYYKVF